jgi:hypothetical protein
MKSPQKISPVKDGEQLSSSFKVKGEIALVLNQAVRYEEDILCLIKHYATKTYDGVSKNYRTGRLERELQMIQLSATMCICIAIL